MKSTLQASLAAIFVLAACKGDGEVPPEAPQAVRVVAVREGPVVEGRSYLAEVASRRVVKVLAQVQGTIAALPVREGETAAEGAYLAHIAAPDTMARLERIRAELDRARRERDFVCDRLATDRVLFEAGDVSPEQLEASEKNCSSATLAVQAAEASERELLVVTARRSEKAPFDGVVLEHLVEPGQTVMPGTPLLVYGSAERELVMQVPSTDLAAGLGEADAVVFGGGRGTVSSVGAWAKGPGQLVEVRVAVDGDAALPPVGSTIDARLVLEEVANATAVPVEAVGEDEQGSYVLVVHGGKLERVPVQTGPREAGWVAVDPSLEPGSRVVVGQLDAVDIEREVLAVEVGS